MGTRRPTQRAEPAPSDELIQELRLHREAIAKAAREAESSHSREQAMAGFRRIVAATIKGAARTEIDAQAVRAVSRADAHEAAILDALRGLGFDPLRLPPPMPGKPSLAKQAARAALPRMSRAVFDKAWLRLRRAPARIAET
jgi:hypothetical protein